MVTPTFLIAGFVAEGGNGWTGTGFTVAHPATGTYEITYTGDVEITSNPIFLVNGLVNMSDGSNQPAVDNVFVVGYSGGHGATSLQFTVYSYDLYNSQTGGASNVLQDAPFGFAVVLVSA